METFIYWLLVLGYFLLGLVSGLIIVALLYPVVRTLPRTVFLVIAGQLRTSALVSLVVAFLFPILLLLGGYFLINLFTPAWNIVSSRSFLTAFIFTFITFLVSGGTSQNALREDYADFVRKHIRIPDGSTLEELQFARAVRDWWTTSDSSQLVEMQSNYMYQLADAFDFDLDHEPGITKAFEFINADSENIHMGIDIYRSRREYVMSMGELEAENDEQRGI
jgi:MFS family permease